MFQKLMLQFWSHQLHIIISGIAWSWCFKLMFYIRVENQLQIICETIVPTWFSNKFVVVVGTTLRTSIIPMLYYILYSIPELPWHYYWRHTCTHIWCIINCTTEFEFPLGYSVTTQNVLVRYVSVRPANRIIYSQSKPARHYILFYTIDIARQT